MKDKILAILQEETFNIQDEAGNNLIVIEAEDFDMIANKILNLFK